QIVASLEDKLDIRMNRFEKYLNDMKDSFVTPTAPIKAVEEKNQQDFQKSFKKKQDDFQNQIMSFMQNFNNNKASSSSSLPRNTIPNPRNEANAITTRSGVSYNGPPIPPPGVEKEPTEVTKDTELPSIENIQPPSVQVPDKEPVDKPFVFDNLDEFSGPLIPIHIVEEERIGREHVDYINRMEMLFTINPRPHPSVNANTNVESLPSLPIPVQDNDSQWEEIDIITIVLKKLPEKLGDPGRFLSPYFVVLDFIVDPRVLLILGRPFLSTANAIINVHERDIILRQDKQSLTLQCGDTPSIKKYKFESLNKVDFIDARESDFYSEEIENFLNDNSIPIGVENSVFNMEEDILYLESLLSEDPSPPPLMIPNQTKSSIKEPEHSFSMGREHVDYINRMEMLFTINPRPRPSVNANTNVESLPSLPIPVQDNDSQREEIDIITSTDDVLPPDVENDDDSDREIDVVEELRVDNSISNSANEYSNDEASDFDNPSVPLPPSKPPDEEFNFEKKFEDEISVVRNTIVEFEYFNPKDEFDVSNDENDDYSYFMFVIFADL
nr:hypothetical protein [Tanacetum cinerariifolium]